MDVGIRRREERSSQANPNTDKRKAVGSEPTVEAQAVLPMGLLMHVAESHNMN